MGFSCSFLTKCATVSSGTQTNYIDKKNRVANFYMLVFVFGRMGGCVLERLQAARAAWKDFANAFLLDAQLDKPPDNLSPYWRPSSVGKSGHASASASASASR